MDRLPGGRDWAQQQADDGRPSLFELLAETQLKSLLPPSLRYCLVLATSRRPRYLLPILNAFDELYALWMLLLERHQLRTTGGSFTESFYRLRRERAPSADVPRARAATPRLLRNTLALSSRDMATSLALLVGLPYLKRKLDDAYELQAAAELLGGYRRRRHGEPLSARLLRFLYPGLQAAFCLTQLAFQLAYLAGRSRFHDPLLWLARLRLRRTTAEEEEEEEEGREGLVSAAASSPVSALLSALLPAGIFALKLVEWWHQSEIAKRIAQPGGDDIQPPPPLLYASSAQGSEEQRSEATTADKDDGEAGHLGGILAGNDEAEARTDGPRPPVARSSRLPILVVAPPRDSNCCPICGDAMTTPTACQTGIVYCYVCIHRWLEGSHRKQELFMATRAGRWESGQGRCAVTGQRLLGGTDGLRRIMA